MTSRKSCFASPQRNNQHKHVQFASSCAVYSGVPWSRDLEETEEIEATESYAKDKDENIDMTSCNSAHRNINFIGAALFLVISLIVWLWKNKIDISFKTISETVVRNLPVIIREYLEKAIL